MTKYYFQFILWVLIESMFYLVLLSLAIIPFLIFGYYIAENYDGFYFLSRKIYDDKIKNK